MVRKRRPKSAGATPARLPRLRATGAGSTPGRVSGETKGTAGPAVSRLAESSLGAPSKEQRAVFMAMFIGLAKDYGYTQALLMLDIQHAWGCFKATRPK